MSELTNNILLNNKFVNYDGLNHFWENAKSYVDTTSESSLTSAKSYTDEEILKVNTAAKTYSIEKITSGLDENVQEAYKLVVSVGGAAATPVEGAETIKIYKDSSLISVDLVDENEEGTKGQFLKYTYILANGEETTKYVNVSEFLVQAEFKNGLEVSAAGEVSVKVDAASESFLTVGEDGIKLSGVQSAIDQAEADAIATSNEYADGLNTAMNTRVEALEAYDTNLTDVVIPGLEQGIADAEANAKSYADEKISELSIGNYYSKTEVDGLLTSNSTADQQYADGLNTAMNTRVEALEAYDTNLTDVVIPGLEQGIADAEANAKSYADSEIAKITFATNGDIDAIFGITTEAGE